MTGIVDVHSHILPGIDDGSGDQDETRRMLQMAYDQGVRIILATPHSSHRQNVEHIRELVIRVNEEASDIASDFHVYLGQEIYFEEDSVRNLQENLFLTLNDTRYVLVEFHPDIPYQRLYRAIRQLTSASYLAIVAHVERYHCLRKQENMEDLLHTGALLQMNYTSVNGGIFDSGARWCRKQLKEGHISFMGTDMHGSEHRRPELTEALNWMHKNLPAKTVYRLTSGNAKRVLEGQPLAERRYI